MKPTVGRLVYYKSYGTPKGEFTSEERAAIITRVHNDNCVDLCVINPTGFFFNQSVTQGSDGGQWDWMPYQKGQAAKTEVTLSEFEKLFHAHQELAQKHDELMQKYNGGQLWNTAPSMDKEEGSDE